MAFSLACDAGKTILRIEGIDTNVTWNDVANAGAGSVAVDGGGTEDPSFFVTEHVANGVYQILKNIQFGDGSNALTFYSKNELVYFDDNQGFDIEDNATLQLGEISNGYSINGAYWSWEQDGSIIASSNPNAVFNVYGSRMYFRATTNASFWDGTIDFRNSIWSSISRLGAALVFYSGVDSLTLKDLYINNCKGWSFLNTPDIFEDVWFHHVEYGTWISGSMTLINLLVTDESDGKLTTSAPQSDKIVNLVNPRWIPVQAEIHVLNDTDTVNCQFTCDIHIVDKDGNNLQGVTVICEDKDSNEIFNVQTDANGVITQQTITYKKWEGTAETETEYSPHKFTFSKNGYTLLVMENVTVDARINWDVEVKFPERIRARMANPGRLAILR